MAARRVLPERGIPEIKWNFRAEDRAIREGIPCGDFAELGAAGMWGLS
jgi:hypothetical protein